MNLEVLLFILLQAVYCVLEEYSVILELFALEILQLKLGFDCYWDYGYFVILFLE